MSGTISPTFTFVKDGVFYFGRRIANELKRHYTSPRIAYSLRTRSAKIAEARAGRAADQLDGSWSHLRSRDGELPGKHLLRLGARECAADPLSMRATGLLLQPPIAAARGDMTVVQRHAVSGRTIDLTLPGSQFKPQLNRRATDLRAIKRREEG